MVLHWFRRDLRLEDNAALYHALKSGEKVQPIFIFDEEILDKLSNKSDRRISFIHHELKQLNESLKAYNSQLWVFFGNVKQIFIELLEEGNINGVYANEDYEPYALERDSAIQKLLETHNLKLNLSKDHVVLHKTEVLKHDGSPYTVFSPYMRKWKATLTTYHTKAYQTLKYASNFNVSTVKYWQTLSQIGFQEDLSYVPNNQIDDKILDTYHETRDLPWKIGTTRISVHLRFGTISIRQLIKLGLKHNEKWLNELIWRDFYQMIIWHFPHSVNKAFKPKYDHIPWSDNMLHFEAWCKGETGYPIVDAGMKELNTTGFMHNRVRMIVASFLCKHLLLDWRLGERYFAEKLLDFDLASNVGGWQWAASSGCDAAPYFRVFNPYLQTDKFDKDRKYINKWVPNWQDPFNYPKPIVDHKIARQKAIDTYKEALKGR